MAEQWLHGTNEIMVVVRHSDGSGTVFASCDPQTVVDINQHYDDYDDLFGFEQTFRRTWVDVHATMREAMIRRVADFDDLFGRVRDETTEQQGLPAERKELPRETHR